MSCPHCGVTATTEQAERTLLGYRKFRCPDCRRRFNERTGTPFNFLEYPTDIVLLVIVWRLRYKLSLRDLAEMFLTRGFGVCEIVRCCGQIERDKVVTIGDVARAASGGSLQLGAENVNCHHYGPCGLVHRCPGRAIPGHQGTQFHRPPA
jgi:hypothetical protein